MEKLLEMLGVQKLDEKEQEAIKEKLETLIELKAKETVDEMLKTEKDKLIEQYEEKFDAYKEDITAKFSNFVDEILDEQMSIPDKVLEFARKGELYADLIEQFKVRLGVDEGLLDEEVKALLKEAKGEITGLRSSLDETISDKLEVTKDAQELAAELYVRRKCDGLTEGQKLHVMQMLEGVADRNEIDRKFDVIFEAYNGNGNGKKKDDDDEDDDEDMKKKKKKKKEMEEALQALDTEIDEAKKDKKKKKEMDDDDDKKKKKDESTKGKGRVLTEGDDDANKVDEDDPFKLHLDKYVQVLQENKM